MSPCCSGGWPVRQRGAETATRMAASAGETLKPADLGLHNADEARAFAEQVRHFVGPADPKETAHSSRWSVGNNGDKALKPAHLGLHNADEARAFAEQVGHALESGGPTRGDTPGRGLVPVCRGAQAGSMQDAEQACECAERNCSLMIW